MKRLTLLFVLCVGASTLIAAPVAGARPGLEPEPAWALQRFDPLSDTLQRIAVITIVGGLSEDPQLGYEAALAEGEVWRCISMVLERLAIAEETVFESGTITYEDTKAGLASQQMRHSGRLWSFWHALAELKARAERENWTAVFDEDVLRLFVEMEESMTPHLDAAANEW